METRPTSDKTKETLFNVLAPFIYSDSRFLDLFSGSGAIGIEALSRGAAEAVFVERNKEAVHCITENLRTCHLENRGRIMKMDVLSALSMLSGKGSFDLVFMDPPYQEGQEKDVLTALAGSGLLAEEGLVILECANETPLDFLKEAGFTIVKEKRYKNNRHVFCRQIGAGADAGRCL